MNKTPPTTIAADALAPPSPPGEAPDASLGFAPALAVALSPVHPPAAQEAELRARLFQRVARSASANRPFVTVRTQDGIWQDVAAGVRRRHLHADQEAYTSMLAWHADGAVFGPPFDGHPLDGHAHELLVLEGEVQVRRDGQVHALRANDYLLAQPAIHQHGQPEAGTNAIFLQAQAGTRLYWRRIAPGPTAFGHALPPSSPSSHLARAAEIAWEPLRQGVRIKPFHGEAGRISMLVHFEPGARVPSHGHGHGEECLMLEGDLFLGDVLLRQGDFQFAPRGTGHGELHSDVGCVLFFHGAVDPAVVDPAVSEAHRSGTAPP